MTKKDSAFMGKTHLGHFAGRWFDLLVPEEGSLPADNQNWIVEARGAEAMRKLDPNPSIAYRTYQSLSEEFGIKISQNPDLKLLSVALGDIHINIGNQIEVTSVKPEVSRTDLHIFKGFAQMAHLYVHTRSFSTPRFELLGKPLAPHSEAVGPITIEDIIKMDRIKSYAGVLPDSA